METTGTCIATPTSDDITTNAEGENLTQATKLNIKETIEETTNEESGKSDEIPKLENIKFKIVFNKQKLDIEWEPEKTVASLKSHIHTITGVPPAMQKLMFKGLMKDDQTLAKLGISNGSKLMLVGSKLTDVISVNTKSKEKTSTSKDEEKEKAEPLSRQKPHNKVIEQGVPDDAMPAYKNGQEALPNIPLYGMLNKNRNKIRLTFKIQDDQIWLGTKERTEKISMNSIKKVMSEPIAYHEEYHMLALQLGPTEQSRYWIYWVPAQYVNAIKDTILGKWQHY